MVILGIADLGINLPVLLGQLLSFTFLLIVLRLLVWPLISIGLALHGFQIVPEPMLEAA